MGLTKRRVDAAKPKKNKGGQVGRTVTWDKEIPAFGVRAYSGGKRSYVVRYRTEDRRERMYTIGSASVLTVKQARDAAKRVLGRVAKGEDPAAERKAAREKKDKPATFAELADEWMKLHAKRKRRSWKEDARRLVYIKEAIGKKEAAKVTTLELNRLHQTVADERGQVEANRALDLIRAIYGRKSRKLGLVPANWDNPASGVEFFEERGRIRTVRDEEFPGLLAAIRDYPNPFVAGALLALLFTGLRKTDVLNLKWSDVDFGRGLIALSTQKTGEVRLVPLSEPFRRLLHALPRFEGNPHIFPGRKDGEPLKDIRRGWEAIRTAAGCTDLTIHDFKRTVGTRLALAGENPFVIQRVLGHKDERTARAYVKIAAEMTSGVMDRYASEVETLANGRRALSGGTSDE